MMAKRVTTQSRLADAKGAAAAATSKIRELEGKRADALLRDDDEAASKHWAENERLRVFARNAEEKARLLQGELQKETALRHAKENEALIGRIETKFAAREAVADELTTVLGRVNELILEMFEQGRAIDAAWGWAGGDRHALLLLPEELVAALQYELYRQTAIPRLGGGQKEAPNAGWKFPGARPPRIEQTHLPKSIRSLVDTVRDASTYASDVMRGKRTAGTTAPVVPVVAPEPRERTQAEVELAALLKRQPAMAADPAIDDQAYADLVQQIALAQASIGEQANA
jgi:hypothetical protein